MDKKEKRKQRLLKASHDARMRAKAAKAEEMALQASYFMNVFSIPRTTLKDTKRRVSYQYHIFIPFMYMAISQEELARQDAERREQEPQKWLDEVHAKRQELVDKIKAKKQLREQLSDRRSHASQLRMKSIAALASDAPPPKRRRKGQDGKAPIKAE